MTPQQRWCAAPPDGGADFWLPRKGDVIAELDHQHGVEGHTFRITTGLYKVEYPGKTMYVANETVAREKGWGTPR